MNTFTRASHRQLGIASLSLGALAGAVVGFVMGSAETNVAFGGFGVALFGGILFGSPLLIVALPLHFAGARRVPPCLALVAFSFALAFALVEPPAAERSVVRRTEETKRIAEKLLARIDAFVRSSGELPSEAEFQAFLQELRPFDYELRYEPAENCAFSLSFADPHGFAVFGHTWVLDSRTGSWVVRQTFD